MCGRYQVSTEDEIIEMREIINEVNERYKNTQELASMKTGEIFPTEIAPVLVPGEAKPEAALMKWGFPQWKGTGVIINARAETALEKSAFRSPLMHRRCVIPTTGFFEWQKQENNKTKSKYLFRLPDTKMLYLTGFYSVFPDHNAYVILTTTANSSIAPYHNRMPLILEADKIDTWLNNTELALKYAQAPCDAMLGASAV